MRSFITIVVLSIVPSAAFAQSADDLLVELAVLQAQEQHAGLNGDHAGTPWHQVGHVLNRLQPEPNQWFVDIGCGPDARMLIAACRYFNLVHCVGVEIDPKVAALARRRVALAGLSDRIRIVAGDAKDVDLGIPDDATVVGYAYLWEETLAELRPMIESTFDRFVSYEFAVPGLAMETAGANGEFFYWEKPPAIVRVPITKTVRTYDLLAAGSRCEQCGGFCSKPMSHYYSKTEVVGYKEVAADAADDNPVAVQQQASPPPPAVERSTITKTVETRTTYCRNCQRGGLFSRLRSRR